MFVDEAGFYLLPAVQATYAPLGETPVLHEQVTHDHLSVISAVTPDGRLRMQIHEEPIRGAQVVQFLKHLSVRLPDGRFWIFWDGAPIHRSRAVQQFLATVPADRFRVEALPGYAPELNPDEGVWNALKNNELANVSCLDLPDLRAAVRAATQRLQHRPNRVRSFFQEAGLG